MPVSAPVRARLGPPVEVPLAYVVPLDEKPLPDEEDPEEPLPDDEDPPPDEDEPPPDEDEPPPELLDPPLENGSEYWLSPALWANAAAGAARTAPVARREASVRLRIGSTLEKPARGRAAGRRDGPID